MLVHLAIHQQAYLDAALVLLGIATLVRPADHLPITITLKGHIMSPVIAKALAGLLDFSIDELQAYQPQILAAAAKANVDVEASVDLWISAVKVGGVAGTALSLVLPALKAEAVSAVNAAINSGATTKEQALLELIVDAAKNEAAALTASAGGAVTVKASK